MKLIERVRAARKAFWGGGDWVSSDLPGNRSGSRGIYYIPGTRVNWDGMTGDLWTCPAVQACLNWEIRNAAQAPPIVERRQGDGSWAEEPGHPLVALLQQPNPEYDWSVLLAGYIISLNLNGTEFTGIERTNGGKIAELWWLPHNLVRPPEEKGKRWTYWPGGVRIEIPEENLARSRFGIDPNDTRLGLAPTASASRGVYTLQQATTYGANVLRNWGSAGTIVSSKDPNVDIPDPDTVAKLIRDKTSGDQVGGVIVLDWPAQIDHPGATPEQMQIETIQDRPEADVCALFGLPPQVVGLHVGRLSKTYANVKEARESAWEEKVMPMLNLIGGQLGRKLLPEYNDGRSDAARADYAKSFRLAFDYSDVRPLQPDLDGEHQRIREDYKAGVIDRWTAKTALEFETSDADKDVYYSAGGSGLAPKEPDAGAPVSAPKPSGNGKHAPTDWAERVAAELELLHAGSA